MGHGIVGIGNRQSGTIFSRARRMSPQISELQPNEGEFFFLSKGSGDHKQGYAEQKSPVHDLTEGASLKGNLQEKASSQKDSLDFSSVHEGHTGATGELKKYNLDQTATNTKENITTFILRVLSLNENKDIPSLMACFADKVDYYDRGIVSRSYVEKDLSIYFRNWNSIKLSLDGVVTSISDNGINDTGSEITVQFYTNYNVKNSIKTIGGKLRNVWRLRRESYKYTILSLRQWIIGSPQKDMSQDQHDDFYVESNEMVISTFITHVLTMHNKKNIAGLMLCYHDKIDYYDRGLVTKVYIEKDMGYYFKNWDRIAQKLEGNIELMPSKDKDIKIVKFISRYHVENTKKAIDGTVENVWKIVTVGRKLKISDQKQKIILTQMLPTP